MHMLVYMFKQVHMIEYLQVKVGLKYFFGKVHCLRKIFLGCGQPTELKECLVNIICDRYKEHFRRSYTFRSEYIMSSHSQPPATTKMPTFPKRVIRVTGDSKMKQGKREGVDGMRRHSISCDKWCVHSIIFALYYFGLSLMIHISTHHKESESWSMRWAGQILVTLLVFDVCSNAHTISYKNA